MGFGKLTVNFQGALRGNLGLRKNVRGGGVAVEYERLIRIRQRSVGRRVSRFLLDGGLEQLYGFSFVRTVTPIQVEKAAEIVFVGFGINDVVSCKAGLFLRREFQLDFSN